MYALALVGASEAIAQSPREKRAVANCLALVRECQLPDGAFRIKASGAPVWIRPYVANHAALALLAGKEKSDRPRVAEWIAWYVKAQLADGTIDDFEGSTETGWKDNGTRDSVDSYAATFFLVLDRYQRVVPARSPAVLAAARRALDALASVADTDGLTWAKADYKVKYLMDNVEVYGGLIAAQHYFATAGDVDAAAKAQRMHQKMAPELRKYWQAGPRLFAFALTETGAFEVQPRVSAQRRESEGLANLFAFAWISASDPNPWDHDRKEFTPDGGNSPEAPVERWLIAASRLGKAEAADWRTRTIDEALRFTKDNVYLHRSAVTALALTEGPAWLPNLIDEARKPR